MAAQPSLLAELMPWLGQPLEDRATAALAYILNTSAACRSEFDRLLGDGAFQPGPLASVMTQVAKDPASRPDLVGCDEAGVLTLVVESKFWAVLQPRQAWRYYRQLDHNRPGVLLVICPERRIRSLWPEVREQLLDPEQAVELDPPSESRGLWRARSLAAEHQVIMLSWELLLDRLTEAADEFSVRSDLHQLRGLIQRLDHEAFPPLASDMSAPDFQARDAHLRRMVRDTVGRGRRAGWLSTKGLSWGRTSSYHRRFFHFPDAAPPYLALGVEYREALFPQTPIWAMLRTQDLPAGGAPTGAIEQDGFCWLPFELNPEAVYEDVLDDLVAQLLKLRDWLLSAEATN